MSKGVSGLGKEWILLKGWMDDEWGYGSMKAGDE